MSRKVKLFSHRTRRNPVRDHRPRVHPSIRPGLSLFPALKDDLYWDTWNSTVIAQAHAQDVAEVFDTGYVPQTPDDIALFRLKQDFVYGAFVRCLLSSKGRRVVRTYAKTRDAQSVYVEMLIHATASTKATINADTVSTWLETTKLDMSWTDSTEAFLLHWQEQMDQWEELVDVTLHKSDSTKKHMLKKAVRPVPELRQVETTDEREVLIGNPALTFEAYVTLLTSIAQRRDHELGIVSRRRRTPINQLAFSDSDLGVYLDDHGDPYLDANAGDDEDVSDNLLVNYTSQSRSGSRSRPQQRPFIPSEVWSRLSEEARQILRGLDPATGQVFYQWSDSSRNQSQGSRPSSGTPNSRRAQVHESHDSTPQRRVHFSETTLPVVSPDAPDDSEEFHDAARRAQD